MARKHRNARRHEVGELPLNGRVDERMVSQNELQAPGAKRVANIKPQTDRQALYMANIRGRILTFGVGCAGTGKTYCAVSLACEMLKAGEIQKIIITRPAIEAGEDLGYLPGEISEKFAPYFAPVEDVLNERLGSGFATYAVRNEKIVALPLAYMRGHTFKDCFVLLDEAQNTTPNQMKMFLTRIGEGAKVVVNGDASQTDIVGPNGLDDAVLRFHAHKDVGITRFDRSDVVRSGFCMDVLDAYSK